MAGTTSRQEHPAGLAQWLRDRGLAVVGVGLLFAGGYYAIASWGATDGAASLRTPIDGAIPFWPASVIAYAWVYPAAFLPAFVVRSTPLFRRVLIAYLLVIGLSFISFLLFPVSASGLRPPVDSLDPSRFPEWGTALLYRLDPPVNLFPSLHLGLATLSAFACRRAHRRIGTLALLALALAAVSVCTVKQHFVVDALAGLALGFAAYTLVVGQRPADAPDDAFPIGLPSAYVGAVLLLYLTFYAAFLGAG